jgi:hypothetical protein
MVLSLFFASFNFLKLSFLPFFRVLEEIANIDYLPIFHFQNGYTLVFIGLFSPIGSAIGPVHSSLIALVNHPYNRKY